MSNGERSFFGLVFSFWQFSFDLDYLYFWSTKESHSSQRLAVSSRVRVAVRLRPRNAEELAADADFGDCVELQPEVWLAFSLACYRKKITYFCFLT